MDFARPVEALVPGVQGRLLGVLARAGDPMSVRTLAALAGVSPAQAVRVVRKLVALGLVERQEIPPASMVRLARGNLAAGLIARIGALDSELFDELRRTAGQIKPSPASLVLFGSFARGEATAESDLDVLAVRSSGVRDGDEEWTESVASWSDRARRAAGNPVRLIEVGEEEVPSLLRRPRPLWRSIAADGILLAGRPLSEVREVRHA